VPSPVAVTTPVDAFIEAIELLALLQEPPAGLLLSESDAIVHIGVEPVIAVGNTFTVIVFVL
jgi:hypothetical protein